jgi:hypothetical protein
MATRRYFPLVIFASTFIIFAKELYAVRCIFWKQALQEAPWYKRSGATAVVFDNKIWIMGGTGPYGAIYNDVWCSTDGINWTRVTSSAHWAPRYGHTSVVFNNKIWIIGGWGWGNQVYNDVWYSSDGINWTRATENAGWSPRYLHASVVFDNRIWVIGGMGENRLSTYNDVWCTWGGTSWIQITEHANWLQRCEHAAAVFDNKIWVIGGWDRSDVWYSENGSSWTLATIADFLNGRWEHTSVVFDNKIWVMGGMYYDPDMGVDFFYNDVWSSSDGKSWVLSTSSASWSPRYGVAAVVFNGKIWLMSGYSPTIGDYLNDVWYSNVVISGKVKRPDGSPMSGVVITLSGDDNQVKVTDNDGSYSFSVDLFSNYIITPSSGYYSFIPSSRTYLSIEDDMVNQDFVRNNSVDVSWAGEENYASDGLHPEVDTDERDGIGPFTYKIKYVDPENDPPEVGYPKLVILKSGTTIYDIPMLDYDPFDKNYRDGKLYVFAISGITAGRDYSYYFIAKDTFGAVATSEMKPGPIVSTNTPQLLWTGEVNYENDGLHPEFGTPFTTFYFRILYKDNDGDPPKAGYPKLYIKKEGRDIDGSPFAMLEAADGDYVNGKIFYRNILLESSTNYTYYFEVYDEFDKSARTTEIDAPDVNTPSMLYWSGDTGYEADGVEPNTGTAITTTFVFKVMYKDLDNDAVATGYPKLHILFNNEEIPNSPYTMSKLNVPGEPKTGEVYTYSLTISTPGVYMYYFECYEANGLQSAGLPTSISPSLTFSVIEPKPPTIETMIRGTWEIPQHELRNFTLSWSVSGEVSSEYIETFKVYLSSVSSALPPETLIYTGKDTSYKPQNLSYGVKYYWKVAVIYKYGKTYESDVYSFTLVPPPSPTIEVAVKGIQEISEHALRDFTLSWSISGKIDPEYIESFCVYLSSGSTTLPPETLVYTGKDTSYKPQNLSYGVKYYWKVAVIYKYGGAYESEVYTFTLVPPVQKAYNYPNPLLGEGKTNIVFNMRSQGNVVLEIFSPFHDLLYQETYNNLPAGVNLLSWDGSKSDGNKVSSGLYICRISKKYDTGATESEIIKILIIR